MSEDIVALFIPITAIIMSLAIPMVFGIIDYRRRRDIVEAHHKERMAAIERGMELPPLPEALFQSFGTRRPRFLLWGLIWLLVGFGLLIALWQVASQDVAMFALIPIGVGVAMLLYYLIEGRKEAAAEGQSGAS